MDFTPPFRASATGTVQEILGTLALRTEKGQLRQSAIPALLTVKKDLLEAVFQPGQVLFKPTVRNLLKKDFT